MKITVINGQNHKGSTYNIGKLLVDEISGEKEVTEFFLPRDLNHFCIGCFKCVEDETKCLYYKEKNIIMSEVEESDLIIITTPPYFSQKYSYFPPLAVIVKHILIVSHII